MNHEYGTRKTVILVILSCLLSFAFSACETVKPNVDTSKTDTLGVEVQQTQTEIVTGTHDLAGTIDTLKTTTDQIKDGVATKEQITTIVKYVNRSSEQVTSLTGVVDKQTKQIASFQQLRIQDNVAQGNTIAALMADVEKYKPWQGRFWIAVAAIVLLLAGIAGYIVLRIKAIIK